PVVNQERKVAVVLRDRRFLFRILDRDHPLRIVVGAEEVLRRDGETLEDAAADHGTSFVIASARNEGVAIQLAGSLRRSAPCKESRVREFVGPLPPAQYPRSPG